MKINISVEATPQEIREVFGLPDIQDVQKALPEAISAKSERWAG